MANYLLKKMIFWFTPNKLIKIYQAPKKSNLEALNSYVNQSFSQEGEDLILKRIFEGKKKGFYVDVGAHHPMRFSNTYLFYNMGWRGINIDAMPGSMTKFNQYRPEDVNLEIGISDSEKVAPYFVFNETALNTFSKEQAILKNGYKNYKILQTISVKLIPLNKILDQYLPKNQCIDFLNVDAEEYDLEVIKSLDFTRYKPSVILVEENKFDLYNMRKSKINNHLDKNGYFLFAKTFNTLIYKTKK